MAFCPNCGAAVDGRFCSRCGTQIGAVPAGGVLPDNAAAALCYALGLITGVLFLVLAPYSQNRFIRFHAFQAIFFHIAFIALWVADTALALILPFSLHVLTSMIWVAITLAALALWILLLIKAYQGETFKLPVIGDIAQRQA